jgi:hypothetical protein
MHCIFFSQCIGLKSKAAVAALPDPWACSSCAAKGLGQGAEGASSKTSLGKRVRPVEPAKDDDGQKKPKKKKKALTGYNLYVQAQVTMQNKRAESVA